MHNDNKCSKVKAIFFDLGGVVLPSPIVKLQNIATEKGLPKDFINYIISSWGDDGPFQRFERGEIQEAVFLEKFDKHLNSMKWRSIYLSSHGPVLTSDSKDKILNVKLNAKAIYQEICSVTDTIDPNMEFALKRLKEHKALKVFALTNDFESLISEKSPCLGLFDDVIHSHKIGMRKPEAQIFHYACQLANVEFHEAAFLDDIGSNVKAARKLGINTICKEFRLCLA
ncbi:hypothetical protein DSO57_1027298 [Entomophthora muscae]|uniref:Uncharacterized protein n=1 Tax=Entomophthora muscae TaxID=34485 RepID=A0ACC2UMK8_9FUNG|nr:hypothetical protein DSO57_1027298 [Entomophthora muscae]